MLPAASSSVRDATDRLRSIRRARYGARVPRSVLALDLDLDLFSGPFDLLLALVLREEVDLAEVPLLAICVAYLDGDDDLDLEAASEFLVLVASLCELKSRLLLPGEELGDDLSPEEAAEELAERLREYARVKAGAAWLAARQAEIGRRIFRTGRPALAPPRATDRPLSAEDPARLVDAVRRLLEPPQQVDISHLPKRMLPVSVFVDRLRTLLAARSRFEFDEAVVGMDRMSQAVAFWALLELYRRDEVDVAQPVQFGPIMVAVRDAQAPRRISEAVA